MDNLTHSLVGFALAETGLKHRTRLGTATLVIGANFPDIDVIAVPLGKNFEWRRGATHGFLALIVLPFVLAWLMTLWDRYERRRETPAPEPARYRELVILSAIAIATHPSLDFMNTYGMRWLMPFVDRWFYADGLFIVDFWLLVLLLLGAVWSRRTNDARPARVALVAMGVYVVAMLGITTLGRSAVARDFPGHRMMVEPNPIVPWKRDVLLEDATLYRFGTYNLFSAIRARLSAESREPRAENGVWMGPHGLPKNDGDPAIAAARSRPEARAWVRWVRFPMYRVARDGSETVVWMSDARYEGAGWATVEVTLP